MRAPAPGWRRARADRGSDGAAGESIGESIGRTFGRAAFHPDGDRRVDHGLMATVGDPAQDGKFRVPTLRNVARTAPYGHNGYFQNLQYLVDFLATRDVGSADPAVGAWPPPEVPATVDRVHVGHLGLTSEDIDDLVAFLGALTDEPRSR